MLSLSIKNIRQNLLRSSIITITIAIAIASLTIFLSLEEGIKSSARQTAEKSSPLTQIIVHPKTENHGLVSFITQSDEGKLNKETVEQIAKIDGVKNIYPEIQFGNFASVEAQLLGINFITDSMVFGLPKEFIKNDLQNNNPQNSETLNKTLNKTVEPYPAVISRKLLDLYNFTIAIPQNIPTISEETLLGKDITLYPNYSTFFPSYSSPKDSIKLEIVGFSDKVNLLGITLSSKTVQELNKKYAGNQSETEISSGSHEFFVELYVETTSEEKTTQVAKEIEELGYSTSYYQKDIKDIESKLKYLTISLGTISAIILIITALAIISTLLATISERRKQFGLFRALGATKHHIKKLILLESGIIAVAGSIIGSIIGIFFAQMLNSFSLKNLAQTSLIPDALFNINFKIILFANIFGILICLISAYIPALSASKISPIEAIKK